MRRSDLPADNQEQARRLAELLRLEIMDSGHEAAFDQVVALAAQLCQVPMAAISLVDDRRQWFKASVGLDVDETPSEVAFCAWTIRGTQPFVVADAQLDERFSDNPLVVGKPGLRFYAGFPLITSEGVVIGTLVAMDRRNRGLTEDQVFAMQALALQVASLMEVRLKLNRIRDGGASLVVAQRELERQVDERTRELAEESARLAQAERRFRSLWETTTDAVLILDQDSIIQYANPGAALMFGHPVDILQGGPLSRVQPERLRQAHLHGVARFMDSGVKHLDWRAVEAPGLHADGHEFPVEIAFSSMEMEGKAMFVGFIRDITERKRTMAELQQERERAQSTLRCIGDGVMTTNEEGRVAALNPMAERLTGWSQEEAVGRPCGEILPLAHEETGEPLPLPLVLAAGEGTDATPLPANAVLQARHGLAVSVEGSIASLAGVDGSVAGWVIALRDVSHSRALAAQVAFQATHDSLTGLVNRAEFDRRLGVVLNNASRRRQSASLLYLDLDQFKIVNDTCGHVAGDELLKQLSSILGRALRSSDTLARLGGDEFGVLLENCPPSKALQIAETLRDTVSEFNFVWQEQIFATGVSIGHVHFEDDSLRAGEILSKADEACYVAKDQGRNRIHTYQPGEEAQATRHGEMQWVGIIHQALEDDRFVLHAQPIFEVAEVGHAGALPHYEVLLRMQDRDGELIPPMAFIPAAERYNLMPRLDRRVIRSVIRALAGSYADPAQCTATFAINLSGSSISDPDVARFILGELRDHNLPGHCIAFEITETAAIANFANAVRLINEVKAAGCTFSLDDFGSGLSSFAYLKHLPVDLLKIDGSFVKGVATDPVDRAMVASINEIGHLMGLRTIAEFVEDEDILQVLREIGVDYAQGYGLGRPMPLEQVLQQLQDQTTR